MTGKMNELADEYKKVQKTRRRRYNDYSKWRERGRVEEAGGLSISVPNLRKKKKARIRININYI